MSERQWANMILGVPMFFGFLLGLITAPIVAFLSVIEHDWAIYVGAFCAASWTAALIPFFTLQLIDIEKFDDGSKGKADK